MKHPLHPIFFDICKSCDGVESRYDLTRPFVQRGYIFATDGRIAVMSKIDNIEYPPLSAKGPDDLFSRFATQDRCLCQLPATKLVVCSECFDGCECCWWAGEAVSEHVVIHGIKINAAYLTLLKKHGVTEVYVGENDSVPIRFQLHGVEGLLSPMVSA